jgi:hypothetical protein
MQNCEFKASLGYSESLCREKEKEVEMHGWMDGRMDEWIDRLMDG